jgi:Kef-type K+ transport system membrane component KefB/mannitol/fructose-specific phosphotransferase system IIA component
MSQEHLLLFLVQMLTVLGLARLLGEVFRRFGQPALAGEILAGLVLGQTVLGQISPELFSRLFPPDPLQLALFDVVAQIGILFLLLAIGLEVDVAAAWKLRRQSVGVAVAGVVIPLVLGAVAAWVSFDAWSETDVPRPAFALFVAAAVSITAISVVARLLFDMRILKSDLGLLLLSAMAINDVLGWLVLAVAVGLATAAVGAIEAIGFGRIGTVFGAAVLFAAAGSTGGRWLVTRILRALDARGFPSPATPLTFVVCLGLACGIATDAIGLHPIFGFLIAGVMAGDQSALSEHTRSIVTQMVESVFVPLFFAGICLQIDFAAHFDLPLVLAISALSIFGKFIGAWLGALLVRMPRVDRLPVGLAHIPGGSMGVLLAVVAREVGAIGPHMFVAIVFASIVSSLLVGPLFSWALRQRDVHDVLRFFARKGIVSQLDASERYEAIDELVRVASKLDDSLSYDAVCKAVCAREETVGTAAGHGIALPHARLDGLAQPLVVFGISRKGIEWNAVDDQPAHLIFLILTPTDDAGSQLEILARITRGLKTEPERQALLESRSTRAIWSQLQRALKAPRPAEGLAASAH